MKEKKEKLLLINLILLSLSGVFFQYRAIQSIILVTTSLALVPFYNFNYFKNKLSFLNSMVFLILSANFLINYSDESIKNLMNAFFIFIIPIFSYSIYQNHYLKSKLYLINLSYIFSTFLFSIYFIYKYIILIPEHHYDWYLARFKIEYYTGLHGTYGSLWLGVGIILLFSSWKWFDSKYKKMIFITILITLFLGLLIFNSRNVFISLFIISLINIIFFFTKNKKVYFIALFCIALLFVFFSQRYFNENLINQSLRFKILKCSVETIMNNYLIGINFNDIQSKLNTCYECNNVSEYKKFIYNSHCQYLDFFLKGGIVLFLLFIAIIILKIIISLRNKNIAYFNITLLFLLSFLTENVLVRQNGIFIYSFIDILFLGSLFVNKSHSVNKVEKAECWN